MKIFALLAIWSLIGCASAKTQPTAGPEKMAPTPDLNKKVEPTPKAQTLPVQAADTKMSCIKNNDSRSLEVQKRGGGCVLNYTKEGKPANVASSAHGTSHCEKSKQKIREKLEKAGFKCT